MTHMPKACAYSRRLRAIGYLSMLCLFLAACGGSGGAPRPTPMAPPPPPPESPPPSENFDTQEFRSSTGLQAIRAIAAYEAGGTGEGVVVGVIDTGIDLQHDELIDAISPFSADVTTDRTNPTVDDENGHGTMVAGIIAAKRNDRGTMGVAFESTILAARADDPDSCLSAEEECTFFDRDIAQGIRLALNHNARVINISLGGDGFSAVVLQAVREAAARGVLVVISAGNDGEMNPSGFAKLANDPLVRGHMLIVGSTDSLNQISSFSNRAGDLADLFLVAPGENILATFPQDKCNPGPGICLARGSGTSFSAPHVAGAAALLAQMFPNLTGRDIFNILLASATDLGQAGIDPIFGHGLLNLEAAIQPIGTTSIPSNTAGTSSVNVGTAGTASSAAFGDAFHASDALDGILMIDRFRRSYRINLADKVEKAPATLHLQTLIDRPRHLDGGDVALGQHGFLSFSAFDDRFAEARRSLSPSGEAIVQQPRPIAYLTGRLDRKSTAAMAYGFSPARLLNRETMADSADSFSLSARIDTPFLAFSENIETLSINRQFLPRLRLDLAFSHASHRGNQRATFAPLRQDSSMDSVIAQLGMPLGPANVRMQVGSQSEAGSTLGSRSSGAFTLGEGAESRFIAFDATLPLGEDVALFGRYLTGTTQIKGAASPLFTALQALKTESFAAGIIAKKVFHPDDKLGIVLLQPLRVSGGSAEIRVPVIRDFDTDSFQFENRTLSFAPSGREIDLELSYTVRIAAHARLEAGLIQQFNAGHVHNGPSITSLIFRAKAQF